MLSQKSERDALLSRDFLPRSNLALARASLDTPLVKVVTGPRRAGKSVFALQMLAGRAFAYVNFDDERLSGLHDFDELLKAMAEVYGDTRTAFFDEIQNISGWELFVNRLHRQGWNLVITGSNAHLLSGELATHLTGRYREFRLYPFSFAEFLLARKFNIDETLALKPRQGELLHALENYMHLGGFPEVVLGAAEPNSYLQTLFESVLLKDVVRRYNVRYAGRLLELGRYLLANNAREYTFRSVANALGFASVHTLENYLRYMSEAFLLFSVNRFSFKARERVQAPRKIYASDNGFVSAVGFRASPDLGRLLEAVVAIELMRRGHEFYSYKEPNSKEVDFVLREAGTTTELIQVCFDLADPKTRKRELAGLAHASQALRCDKLTVLSWSEEADVPLQGQLVAFVPVWKWLLGKG